MCDHLRHQNPVLCLHCDLLVTLPSLAHGQKGSCPRCSSILRSHWLDQKRKTIGFAIGALVMQGLANLFPIINVEISGIKRQITLPEISLVMANDHFFILAGVFLLCVQIIPTLCMIMIILLCMEIPIPFRLKSFLAKLFFALYSWNMSEIFLVGALISFAKLMTNGRVNIGNGFIPFCFFCLLQLRALQCIENRWLWNVIMPYTSPVKFFQFGQGGLIQRLRACSCCTIILPADTVTCPRCHTKEGARRSNSLQWTLALLLTSLILYIPANLLPIIITDKIGNRINSTIMSGVILLWEDGSIPIAIIIFIVSIVVPSLKMIILGWLCWSIVSRAERKINDSKQMYFLYKVVELIGHWSMIDVFVITVLSSLVRMGKLMNISPGIGSIIFAVMVILTMIASKTFDPRLLWDETIQSRLNKPNVNGK